MTYKNNLPDNCPNSDIENIKENKIFFRITKNSPPNDSDFIPLWFDKNISDKECLAKGVSVSENFSDAKTLIKKFKKLGKYIYSGIIKYESDGIVKCTPSYNNPSHRTWYPYTDTIEREIFNKEVE